MGQLESIGARRGTKMAKGTKSKEEVTRETGKKTRVTGLGRRPSVANTSATTRETGKVTRTSGAGSRLRAAAAARRTNK